MGDVVKFILQVIGLATVIWLVYIVWDEYRKIKEKEKDNG